MENWPGVVLACLLGLFFGGAIGGLVIALLFRVRSGRVKVPPSIAIGPLKLDTSGLVEGQREGADVAEAAELGPVVESASSATGGCLALLAATMVLIGFILPWFTCNLVIISGSFSGFTVLVQTVLGVLLAFFAAAEGTGGVEAFSLALMLILMVAMFFVALIPLAGLSIGRSGLRLIQSLGPAQFKRKDLSRSLVRASLIGIAPLACYITTASANLNLGRVPLLGGSLGVTNADTGVWVTLGGFLVALLTGLVISALASLEGKKSADSTSHRPPGPGPIPRSSQIPGQPPKTGT